MPDLGSPVAAIFQSALDVFLAFDFGGVHLLVVFSLEDLGNVHRNQRDWSFTFKESWWLRGDRESGWPRASAP
jgi:hypothetical protein